jgi:hypothetical protein
VDLLRAAPHVPDEARYTRAQWLVYREGYTTALVFALRAMDAAVDRWRAARAMRREIKKQKWSA